MPKELLQKVVREVQDRIYTEEFNKLLEEAIGLLGEALAKLQSLQKKPEKERR